jgi:hypothetical protein
MLLARSRQSTQSILRKPIAIPTRNFMSEEAIRIADGTICWGKNVVFAPSWRDAACIDKDTPPGPQQISA